VSIGAETSLLGRVIDEGDRGTLIRLDDGREIRFRLFHREELIDQAWDVLAAE
jgi:hypothetical protein